MRYELRTQKISEHCQCNHNCEEVISLQILHYCVVHQKTELRVGFDEQSRKQIGDLFEIQILRLA